MNSRMETEIAAKVAERRRERESLKKKMKQDRQRVNQVLQDHGVQLCYDMLMERELSCALELISSDAVKIYVTICSELDQWGRPNARERLAEKVLRGDSGYIISDLPGSYTRVDKNGKRQLNTKGFRRVMYAVKCLIGADACMRRRHVPHDIYENMKQHEMLYLYW